MFNGLNLDRILPLDKLEEVARELPHEVYFSIVFDPNTMPRDYLPTIRLLRNLGHKVMGRLVDSSSEKMYDSKERRRRALRFIKELADDLSIIECGNEINGPWTGSPKDVVQKVNDTILIAKEYNLPTAVTWYYVAPYYRLFYWMKRYPLDVPPDYALVSFYPNWENAPKDWSNFFEEFHQVSAGRTIGFGEYGAEPLIGQEAKRKVVNLIETLEVNQPFYEKFGFYWDGALDVVQSKELLPLLKRLWA